MMICLVWVQVLLLFVILLLVICMLIGSHVPSGLTQEVLAKLNTPAPKQAVDPNSMAIRWIKWGSEANLTISASQNLSKEVQAFRIEGKTGNYSAGFESQNLNSTAGYVLVAIGDTIKSSRKNYTGKLNPFNFQVTISLQVKGKHGVYFISLVNGNLEDEGWAGKRHFQLITPYSLQLLNLRQILMSNGDEYVSLEKVIITVERNSKLSTMEFAFKLYEDFQTESNIFRTIRIW